MENDEVREFIARYAPEIQEQFELVLNTTSMEKAVEQAERADGDDTPFDTHTVGATWR